MTAPVVFTLGRSGRRSGWIPGLFFFLGGGYLVVSACTVSMGVGARIGISVGGALVFLLGCMFLGFALFGPHHRLVLDGNGFGMAGLRGGGGWQVRWDELSAVAATTRTKVHRAGTTPIGIPVTWLEFTAGRADVFASAHHALQRFHDGQGSTGSRSATAASSRRRWTKDSTPSPRAPISRCPASPPRLRKRGNSA